MSQEGIKQLMMNKQWLMSRINPQKIDKFVTSIIITEMYFRDNFHRYMEYILWLMYWFFLPYKLNTLSIGLAQIQLRHWCRFGFINSLSPNWRNFHIVTNPTANYEACKKYLEEYGYRPDMRKSELARIYTGKARKYYVSILTKAFNLWQQS